MNSFKGAPACRFDKTKLPYPLAVSASRLEIALSTGDAVRGLLRLRDCVECGLRYLATVLLADAGPAASAVLPALVSSGSGGWLDGVIRPLADRAKTPPAVRVAAAVSRSTDLRRQLREFIAFRNGSFFGHAPLPIAEDVLGHELQRWLPLVDRLTATVADLAEWPLCAVAGGRAVERWMGETPPTSVERSASFALTESDETALLNLYPFISRTGDVPTPLLYDRLTDETGPLTALALDYTTGVRREVPELAAAIQERYGVAAVQNGIRGTRQYRPTLTDFGAVIDRNADLIRRAGPLARIAALLAQHDCGVILLEGPPGAGKTGLAVALLRELARSDAPAPVFYFFSRADGRTDPDECARHLYWSLWEAHGRPAGYDRLDPQPERARERLAQLLRGPVQTSLRGRPQVILIDALDEADGAVTSWLPWRTPGVRVVVTSRPGHASPPAGRRWADVVDLAAPDTVNDRRGDARRLAERHVADLGPELVDRVSRYGDGNFLVVALLCRHARAAGAAAVSHLLDHLPGGGGAEPTAAVFEMFWQAALAQVPEDGRASVCLAAAALAQARAPLTDPMARALLGLDAPAWERVRDDLGEFLTPVTVVVGEHEYEAHRLFHEAFAEFLRGHLADETANARDRLAAYCGSNWADDGPEAEYALRYAVAHACGAITPPRSDFELVDNLNRFARIRELVTSPAYLEARVAAGQVFALAVDLDRAELVAVDSPGCSDRRIGLIASALRQRIHFVARQPEALLTCLWMYGWWYDHPSVRDHLSEPAGGWDDGRRPWEWEPGSRVCDWLEQWRARRALEAPPRYWVRSLRPPAVPLDPVSPGVLEGHTADVNLLAYSPDGTRLYTGSWDDLTFREWRADSGQPVTEMDGVAPYAVGFRPDGRVLVAGPVEDGMTDVIVRAAWNPTPVFHMQMALRFRGAFPTLSADGRRVACGGDDCLLRVWDVDTGDEVFSVLDETATDDPNELAGARCLALSLDGRFLAAGTYEGDVRVWDVGAGTAHVWRRPGSCVNAVAFSPDGKRVLCGMGDGSIYLVDPVGGSGTKLSGPVSPAWRVAFAPTGDRVASGHEDGSVQVIDLSAGHWVVTLRSTRHRGSVSALAFRPDGWWLASGGEDRSVRLWNLSASVPSEGGRPTNHPGTIHKIDFSSDGSVVHTYSLIRDTPGFRAWMFGEADGTYRTWDAVTGLPLSCGELTPERSAELFGRWDAECPNAETRRVGAAIPPVPSAPTSSRWRAESGSDGTVIFQDGQPVAVYPVALDAVAQHPTGPVWAGAEGSILHLIALEPHPRSV